MIEKKCINCKFYSMLNSRCRHPDTEKVGELTHEDNCGRFTPVESGNKSTDVHYVAVYTNEIYTRSDGGITPSGDGRGVVKIFEKK